MDDGREGDVPAEEQLRRNVAELMKYRRMKQGEVAERLGRPQPWLSRRMSADRDKGTRFQVCDLDALADIFGVSPAQLLCAGNGQWDRRKNGERRCGQDRRRNRPIVPRD